MKSLKVARRRVREIIVKAEGMILCETPSPYADRVTVDSPEKVATYWRENIGGHPLFPDGVESLHVILLSTRRHVLGHCLVAQGLLDQILVHAREVFRPAIMANAHAVALIHNHPSGDPSPSEADIRVTRDLMRAGHLLKIEVLDHVVMGRPSANRPKDYASLRELGYCYT